MHSAAWLYVLTMFRTIKGWEDLFFFFLSEESIDLFGLGVQVDVIETRPSGEARDGGHLGSTKRERMEL